jgi:hypothetical protein
MWSVTNGWRAVGYIFVIDCALAGTLNAGVLE